MPRVRKQSKQLSPSIPVKKSGSMSIMMLALSLLIVGALAAAAYARNGIYRTHVTLWDNVTKQSPNKRRAHENYGQALSTAGSIATNQNEARKLYDAALQQFQMVLSLKDDGSVPMRDLYREIGVVYFRQGRYDDAIAMWQKGLTYAQNDPSLLNNLSIAYMQVGRFDEAASIASTALAVDPNMPQALNTMGQVYMAKNDFEHAAQYFLKAVEREPDVAARYWNAALALERAKKYDTAFQYASRYAAMESDPIGRQRAFAFLEHLKVVMRR
jgi:tetratricopeptide (TPR) repeat protein